MVRKLSQRLFINLNLFDGESLSSSNGTHILMFVSVLSFDILIYYLNSTTNKKQTNSFNLRVEIAYQHFKITIQLVDLQKHFLWFCFYFSFESLTHLLFDFHCSLLICIPFTGRMMRPAEAHLVLYWMLPTRFCRNHYVLKPWHVHFLYALAYSHSTNNNKNSRWSDRRANSTSWIAWR